MYEPVVLALGLLACMAVGEVLATITRARVPSLLISMALYLAAVWSGLFSQDAVDQHTLVAVGNLLTGLLVMHLGTMMPLRTLKVQYKYVLVALAGMVGAVALVVGVGSFVIGYHASVAGAGPIAGGFIATLISTTKLTEIGMDNLVPIPALVLGLQQLIGLPIAMLFLRRYALKWVANARSKSVPVGASVGARAAEDGLAPASSGTSADEFEPEHDGPPPFLPVQIYSPAVILVILTAGTLAAMWIGETTGVSYTLWCLVIGFVLRACRLLPARSLDHAGSFGFATTTVTLVVIVAVGAVTPQNLLEALVPTLVILVLGPIGIMIGGSITAKLLRLDKSLATPVALTALFGFPGDFIICQEVAGGVAQNEAERKAVLNHIFPPLLIGGFTTVTTGSVVVASILMSTL